MKSRKPHNSRLLLFDPVLVLGVSPLEVGNPVYEVLESLGCKLSPEGRKESIKE